tara:strand:- start:121 stop:459 length:339 start_codon:yes stop_codon:yes gene_type:complete
MLILFLIIIFIIVCFNIYDGIIFRNRYNKKTNKECDMKKKCEINQICKSNSCYNKDLIKTQSLLKSFVGIIIIFVIIGVYYLAKFLRNVVENNENVATIYGGYSIFNIFRKF